MKKSEARLGRFWLLLEEEEEEDVEGKGWMARSWSCFSSVIARSGVWVRDASERIGGEGRAARERRRGGTAG